MGYLNKISKKTIEEIIFTQTPITDIHYVDEGHDFLQVEGRAGENTLTYRIYDNGTVVEK